jgi:hypothetical protein
LPTASWPAMARYKGVSDKDATVAVAN